MSAGLFGKLPAKRDFVAVNAPRRFLETWEPWLQSSVATSKQTDRNGLGRRATTARPSGATGSAPISAAMR